jgi:hypothetical protein
VQVGASASEVDQSGCRTRVGDINDQKDTRSAASGPPLDLTLVSLDWFLLMLGQDTCCTRYAASAAFGC